MQRDRDIDRERDIDIDIEKNITNNSKDKKPVSKWNDPRNKELQDVIDYAYTKGFNLQGNKTWNRRAAYNLLRTKDPNQVPLGVERVKKLIDVAMACQGEQYAPQCSDFRQLKNKWQNLLAFVDKKQSGGCIG